MQLPAYMASPSKQALPSIGETLEYFRVRKGSYIPTRIDGEPQAELDRHLANVALAVSHTDLSDAFVDKTTIGDICRDAADYGRNRILPSEIEQIRTILYAYWTDTLRAKSQPGKDVMGWR